MLKIDRLVIKARMLQCGIETQVELARRSGLPTPTVSRVIGGQRPFLSSTVDRLAQALACSPLDLLTNDPA